MAAAAPAPAANRVLVVNGYQAVPVFKNSEIDEDEQPLFYIYTRRHSTMKNAPEDPSTPKKRTLFVTNLPPYCTQDYVQRLFSECGTVELVTLVTPLNASDFAYVAFSTSETLARALKLTRLVAPDMTETELSNVGMKKWLGEISERFSKNQAEMQSQVDEFMRNFAQQKEEEYEQAETEVNKPDADGFVKVTYRGKKTTTDGDVTIHATRNPHKKGRDKVMLDFYRFQRHEQKQQQLEKLRENFEVDKQRISKMKQSRNFKPY